MKLKSKAKDLPKPAKRQKSDPLHSKTQRIEAALPVAI
jgi:hypothetical protein